MYVSMKKKDNKTVMGHKSNDNLKQNITRISEFGSETSLMLSDGTIHGGVWSVENFGLSCWVLNLWGVEFE